MLDGLKNKSFLIFYGILFAYILGLTFLFPLHGWDEILYSKEGNPFVLQYQEFLNWHGRFFTHTLARMALQSHSSILVLSKALITFFLFYFSFKVIKPSMTRTITKQDFILVGFFFFINALFPTMTFMMYYGLETLPLFTYYIMAIFLLIFLQYYINLFQDKTTINLPIFLLIAFITGSLHEMVIAVIPFMILVYILLKINKKAIPSWFWLSLPFFLLGFSAILLSPGNAVRLDTYVNTSQWEFFGQTINWTELGFKKYIYAFIRHAFYTTSRWYSGPGFVPTSWYIQLLILLFNILNFRRIKNFFDPRILNSFLFFAFAWATVLVMSASPMYHSVPVEFSKFFLYLSLTIAFYYFIETKSIKLQTILATIFFLTVFIGQGIQIKPIFDAKQEYLALVKDLEEGKIDKITKLPTAKLGNVTIIKFGGGLPLKYPHVTFEGI
ncbi:MAG: DUF6056 family protein [Brevinema sp.]